MSNLTADDLSMFARLGILPELLAAAGVLRVTDAEARRDYGMKFDVVADLGGIVFPYPSPVTGNRTTARVRRDHPEIVDGKPKNKYISGWGDPRHLYFPPGAAEKLKDPDIPIAYVESEKAVLALTAWSRRTGVDLIPLGMGGCWGWRSQRARSRLAANGERVPVAGPLHDLNYGNDRRVYVLLDNNKATNPDVQHAESALSRELAKAKRNCMILVCDLPRVDGVNGPDDYIGACGDEAMKAVFAAAHRPLQSNEKLERMARDWWCDVCDEKMVRFLNEEPTHYTLGKMGSNIIVPVAPRLTWTGFHVIEARAGSQEREKEGKTITTPWSKVFLNSPLRRDYYGECYVPNGPREVWDAVLGGHRLNVYRPTGIVPAKGDVSLFLAYLASLIEKEEERQMVLRWWAHIVQHPDEPLNHMLLIWSPKRHIGKSLLGKIMTLLIGPPNVALVGDKDLAGDFAAYLHHTVLLRAEEITQGTKRDAAALFNMLKGIVGENTGAPNRKHREEPMQAIYSNIYMTSNSPLALLIEKAEWRLLVIEAGTGKEQFSKEQFKELVKWINRKEGQAALLDYFLHEVDMRDFDAHKGAPLTEARGRMAEAGRDALQCVFDSLSTEQGRGELYAQIRDRVPKLPDSACPILTSREIADIVNAALEFDELNRDRFSAIKVGVALSRLGKRKRGGDQIRITKELREILWEIDAEQGARIADHALRSTFMHYRPYIAGSDTTANSQSASASNNGADRNEGADWERI